LDSLQHSQHRETKPWCVLTAQREREIETESLFVLVFDRPEKGGGGGGEVNCYHGRTRAVEEEIAPVDEYGSRCGTGDVRGCVCLLQGT